ncbi:hypothetical protein H5410_060950 [Solanum commersonii]|uniref:Uncharacterized protein n=1 Tax=Solanum commersonii TaxID=4109 RepID=A0A9J5W7M1_SOLCO|nr:hypothetical protein H5410_060950 [Solanum commersonii]
MRDRKEFRNKKAKTGNESEQQRNNVNRSSHQKLGMSLSFVTPYVAMNFDILPEKLCEPFGVSTPVVESILIERVYRDSINHKSIMANLVELDIVDFDGIPGMDWLHSFYDSIDCRTRVVRFKIPNEPVFEWKSSSVVPKGHFILYLKGRNLVS